MKRENTNQGTKLLYIRVLVRGRANSTRGRS